MAKDIYSSLSSVGAKTRPRRHLQPEPDMGMKKSGGMKQSGGYGLGSMGSMGSNGGMSNKKKTGRYRGLA